MAGDHDPCPRCGYENARCACPKAVPPASKRDTARTQALVDSVLEAIQNKKK